MSGYVLSGYNTHVDTSRSQELFSLRETGSGSVTGQPLGEDSGIIPHTSLGCAGNFEIGIDWGPSTSLASTLARQDYNASNLKTIPGSGVAQATQIDINCVRTHLFIYQYFRLA